MSNLAEKLPKFVRTRVEAAEARGRELAQKVDRFVDARLPHNVTAPLRTDDGLSLEALRKAVEAAGDELKAWVKRERKAEDKAGDEAPATKKAPAAKKAPAKKAPAAQKAPAAKKAPAKKAPARKAAAKKPAAEGDTQKPAPRRRAPKKAATPTEGAEKA